MLGAIFLIHHVGFYYKKDHVLNFVSKYYVTLQVRSNIHALHVDVKEGQSEIIIRFDSSKAANEVSFIYIYLDSFFLD